jgi:hypothetical protein
MQRDANGGYNGHRFGSPVAWVGLIMALTLAVQTCTDLVRRACAPSSSQATLQATPPLHM